MTALAPFPLVHETGLTIQITIVKTLLAITGGLITYFALKAYRRTRQRSLGALAAGFGVVTAGVLLAGVAFDLLGSLGHAILLESVVFLIGFGLIAYSLYAE